MTHKAFKQIRTNVHHLQHVHQPTSGKLVAIVINHTHYSTTGKRSDPNRLTARQLAYFTHLPTLDSYYQEGLNI